VKCTITQIQCQKVLAESSIPLGDYVINPYRGCSFACRYCYVQKNKGVQKRNAPWGSFVDVKVNAPEVLEKELAQKSPTRVLISSTTESYQPIEEKYKIMREILKILNNHQIGYTILTKSPLIIRDCDLLSANEKSEIYFTVNPYTEEIRKVIEPATVSFTRRKETIKRLIDCGIRTHVYVNPVIPNLIDPAYIFSEFKNITKYIDFEGINVKMIDWPVIKASLSKHVFPKIDEINNIFTQRQAWDNYWEHLGTKIQNENSSYNYNIRTFFHPIEHYFGVLSY